MRKVNKTVLNAPDDADATGGTIDANQLVSASFHIHFGDATAAGAVKVQASNDIYQDGYQPANFSVVNWVDIPNQSVTITSGGAAILTVAQMCYRWVRVIFTHSGGGSTTIIVNMFALSV